MYSYLIHLAIHQTLITGYGQDLRSKCKFLGTSCGLNAIQPQKKLLVPVTWKGFQGENVKGQGHALVMFHLQIDNRFWVNTEHKYRIIPIKYQEHIKKKHTGVHLYDNP